MKICLAQVLSRRFIGRLTRSKV
uniref:Uncharacterized protein n=1 Tax=Rhizophora mucronata TaxID=61149 RepID=A0A2P2NU52_RHIMU